jgi:hypothetical protein
VSVTNSSSDIRIECNGMDYETATDDTDGACVYQSGGRLSVLADKLTTSLTNVTSGVWWTNGDCFVVANEITVFYAPVYANVTTSPSGGLYVRAQHLNSTGYQAVYNISTQAEAKVWVDAPLIEGLVQGVLVSGGKTYITAQKIAGMVLDFTPTFGVVECDGGALWVTTEKITTTKSNAIITSAGTSHITVQQIEDLGNMTHGLTHSGGTTRLNDAYIAPGNTVLNTLYPVNVTSTGCTLKNVLMIAPANTSNAIFGNASQNVQLVGCAANKTTSGVTVKGQALTVDAALT